MILQIIRGKILRHVHILLCLRIFAQMLFARASMTNMDVQDRVHILNRVLFHWNNKQLELMC